MEILKAYGNPTKIVDAISILYKDTEAQVITPDGDTEFFEILAEFCKETHSHLSYLS